MIMNFLRPRTNVTKESIIKTIDENPDVMLHGINCEHLMNCTIEITLNEPDKHGIQKYRYRISRKACILIMDEYTNFDAHIDEMKGDMQ